MTAARVNELDSVRGIAAFVVVLHHLWETILPDQNSFPFIAYASTEPGWLLHTAFWISLSPMRLLFSGHAAVGVFFVLSGFALTKSLDNPSQRHYPQFIVRRFFRVYPPFAVVILLTAAVVYFIEPQPISGRDWINLSWTEPLTGSLLAGHLLMLTTAGPLNSLDSPMWTLVHELRISAIFPFVALAAIMRPRATLLISTAVFALFSVRHLTTWMGGLVHPELARDVLSSMIETMRYVLFFVLGILIASKNADLAAALTRKAWYVRVLWPAALLCLAVPYTKAYLEIFYAAGAFLVITLCLISPAAKSLLRHASLRWLGKISYSLYLSHQVVLLTMVHLLNGKWPMAVILPLVIPVSLLVAELLNRFVELPSSELGKRLARAIHPAGRVRAGESA